MLHKTRLERLADDKHSNFLVQFVSYEYGPWFLPDMKDRRSNVFFYTFLVIFRVTLFSLGPMKTRGKVLKAVVVSPESGSLNV